MAAIRDANQGRDAMTFSQATQKATQWLSSFADALARGDCDAAANLFGDPGYWRDLVAFTWNIRTHEGRQEIAAMLRRTLGSTRPSNWRLSEAASESDGVVEAWLTFETAVGRGRGYLRLRDGRCWTLLTALGELKGFEEPAGPRRPRGTQHGAVRERLSWLERRQAEDASLGYVHQPYCLIVGGGQGGMALGARLRRLGVPTLIVDKLDRPGDAWRRRYQSLCLHDPVWFDHMPYMPFPDHWPVFTPKDQMGDWLEVYCKAMELNYWARTECLSASYLDHEKQWVVRVLRDGREVTLRPRHLVLATGMSGVPLVPRFPGMDGFEGKQHHSSQHPGGADYKGKKCVVIGANNSAHDICADLWEHGADVTMVQRSPTLVVKSDSLVRLAIGRLYSEEALSAGITTERADLIAASMPFKEQPRIQIPLYERIRKQDAEFYRGLEAAGFQLHFGEDQSGLSAMYMRRGAGYYIDVGASDLISRGQIGLRSRTDVAAIDRRGVILSDGSHLPADLIVHATGYGPMDGWAERLISREVAEKVGRCWGLGSGTRGDPGPWEGELRNMWKPTRQEALWFHGGNLAQSRFYSLALALQLKARMANIHGPVDGRSDPTALT